MFRLFRRDREKGASAVELAIVLPVFLTLVFGTMEAGWIFAQQVEIRNAAREGARLAVVDYGTAGTIVTAVCDRADLSGGGATVDIAASSTSVVVTVSNPYTTITGFLDPIFGSIVMSSTVEMRTERPLDTLGGGGSGTCP
ncbi:MAG: TadE/TadG family type IV pilus assembly protein [Actinomycetota bacterium]|nr:TadE/TadG family type IV pilus assembly protein [Actinomycetota bacterium]